MATGLPERATIAAATLSAVGRSAPMISVAPTFGCRSKPNQLNKMRVLVRTELVAAIRRCRELGIGQRLPDTARCLSNQSVDSEDQQDIPNAGASHVSRKSEKDGIPHCSSSKLGFRVQELPSTFGTVR
jgi:hypothetical protein